MNRHLAHLFVTGALAGLVAGCGGGDGPKTFDITYRVDGTFGSRVALTYQLSGGSTQQETVGLPYTRLFTGTAGDFLYISGQTQSRAATVTTTIFVNGATFKTATSTGDFVIATASGGCC